MSNIPKSNYHQETTRDEDYEHYMVNIKRAKSFLEMAEKMTPEQLNKSYKARNTEWFEKEVHGCCETILYNDKYGVAMTVAALITRNKLDENEFSTITIPVVEAGVNIKSF